jgi:dihydrofolate synthase/folylpolyglutamate synthase
MMSSQETEKNFVQREDVLRFLFARIDYERWQTMPGREEGLRLDRMRELLGRLGDPQAGLPVVHVAGTKGKGSTAATMAAVLSAAGYRTGLFTSPHLDRLEERMAIDGRCATGGELVELVERIRPVVAEMDRRAADAAAGQTGPT